MDRLTTMTTFAKVVRHGSFTTAGDELGLSRSMVSRQIADLELHLGVRLLNRTTRSVTPTEAGQRYYDFCSRIIAEITREEESLTTIDRGMEGNISILCPKWIGNLDISEALAGFCLQHPKINIRLTIGDISSKTHDFLERGFDLCIETRSIRDSSVKVKKIGEIEYVLVAAPAYLAAHGEPAQPRDLLHHECLVQPGEPLWYFDDGSDPGPLKVQPRFASNSFLSLCTVAVAGVGVAMLPRRVAAADIAAGALQPILQAFPLAARPLYAVYAPSDHIPFKVRTLLSYLGAWFRNRALNPEAPAQVASIYAAARVAGPATQ